MNKKLLLLLFLGCALFSHSQVAISLAPGEKDATYRERPREIVDTCVLKVQYRMSYIRDVKRTDKITDKFMLLQIGKRMSKFTDFYRLKGDSVGSECEKKKMHSSEAFKKIAPYIRNFTPLNVFKNYPSNKITVTDRAFLAGEFKYSEDKVKINWKMQPGTLTVCGYECKKATAAFRGRNYTAWYAPKIPHSDGPWKFWGLPGLILKVTDDKDEYSFECAGVQKAEANEQIYIKQADYFNTTREGFNATVKNAYENPQPYAESSGVVLESATNPLSKSIPFNPIELE